ncbi:hypothetical protein SKAU_G00256350 [Synaphobranchus kaupii]|uniref:Uncharacterized protein n=1 Tax=Synaphobranchus kaupii TaxID=118154 RepID=A0A9Q1F3U6_SYNKA|nr:hypothetical protein SKAU_G00256350 [Synaphobranchus kaupii]
MWGDMVDVGLSATRGLPPCGLLALRRVSRPAVPHASVSTDGDGDLCKVPSLGSGWPVLHSPPPGAQRDTYNDIINPVPPPPPQQQRRWRIVALDFVSLRFAAHQSNAERTLWVCRVDRPQRRFCCAQNLL